MKTVFVTVGTTSFDDLIVAVTSDESVKALLDRGYTDAVLQVGRGSAVPDPDSCPGLTLQVFRFKDSVAEHMTHSDLVISHAGAGSCLEALGANKPLLVVVNDKLMDNHQLELAKCCGKRALVDGLDLSRAIRKAQKQQSFKCERKDFIITRQ